MKEPPGDTHSYGSFIVYEMKKRSKMGKKRAKMPENPQKYKKSARQFYQNHRADLV